MGTIGQTAKGFFRVVRDRYGYRLVAWDFKSRPNPVAGDIFWCEIGWNDYTFAPEVDLAPHRAFCRGDMPAEVYADWLEELKVPLSPQWYVTLRGW